MISAAVFTLLSVFTRVHERVGARRRARRRRADDRARGDHRLPAAVPRQGARRQRARDRAEVAGDVRRVPRRHEDARKAIDPDVLAVQPFIFAEMLVTRGKGELSGVAIKGVDPEARPRRARSPASTWSRARSTRRRSTKLLADPKDGELPPIIIGKELAHKLKAKLGDDVTVVVPLSNIDCDTLARERRARRARASSGSPASSTAASTSTTAA